MQLFPSPKNRIMQGPGVLYTGMVQLLTHQQPLSDTNILMSYRELSNYFDKTGLRLMHVTLYKPNTVCSL